MTMSKDVEAGLRKRLKNANKRVKDLRGEVDGLERDNGAFTAEVRTLREMMGYYKKQIEHLRNRFGPEAWIPFEVVHKGDVREYNGIRYEAEGEYLLGDTPPPGDGWWRLDG